MKYINILVQAKLKYKNILKKQLKYINILVQAKLKYKNILKKNEIYKYIGTSKIEI